MFSVTPGWAAKDCFPVRNLLRISSPFAFQGVAVFFGGRFSDCLPTS